MLKSLGMILGMLFLAGGILGFVPGVTRDGMYFGLFMVNSAHNVMHIVSGALLLIASLLGATSARWLFRILGVFYLAIAVMGLMVGNGLIFGLIMNSLFDSWGHAALGLILLLIGFTVPMRSRLSLP